MDNLCDMDTKALITKEKALELLYKTANEEKVSNLCFFDEYGNYYYPTDLVVDTPNTAIGTPLGLSVIRETQIT